ncbi:MAG: GntR family transcriptional regulator [Mangrovibacterium sp.]
MKGNQSKYKLIVNHVVDGISNGKYKNGDWIPSINEFIKTYKLSRDTVFAGLTELKSKGIIDSNPGVGYFIISTRVAQDQKIFLLFNEFTAFKEDLYNSFIESVGKNVSVDLYFHNYNRKVFDTLINEANGKYTSYIIMSGKFEGIDTTLEKLNGKVYLLDHFHPALKGKYASVFQNFEKDTYEALVFGKEHLEKYRKIIMVQKDEKEPYERYFGLKKFCEEFGYQHDYIDTTKNRKIEKGELYITVNDRDIVSLIKQAELQKLTLGKDFGVISYNDTPLKEVLLGGITTLSTDFNTMGKSISKLLRTKNMETIENPWKLTVRNSL